MWPAINGYQIINSSLRRATFANLAIRNCRFENDDFTRANLSEIGDHANAFVGCGFANASFRGATLGFEGSEYRGCSFQKASFQGAGFVRPIFEGCSFVDCRLRNLDFEGSSFSRGKFVGELRDVWFRNGYSHPALKDDFGRPPVNTMREVDFSAARF